MDKYQGPAQYKPLTAWQYFWLSVLFSVPVVGFVFLIVFSFSKGNINRRSFARSHWCAAIIALIVVSVAAMLIVLTGSLVGISESITRAWQSLPF